MLLEHFFDFFGGGDKYISNTVVADVDSLMLLFVLAVWSIYVNS
jgi:hypothetical protein